MMKAPNIAPAYACIYPGLCEIARSMGYALAIHGSVANDLDLIACPWVDEVSTPQELIDKLMEHIGACSYPDLLRRAVWGGFEMMSQMQTCQRCGGARFSGSGTVGWGGPICNCQYPQIPNPDVPRQDFQSLGLGSPWISIIRDVTDTLKRIEQKLESLRDDQK